MAAAAEGVAWASPAGKSRSPRRGWPSWLAGAISLGLVLAMAFESGGYYPPSYLGAGAVAFAALGAILLVRPPHYPISPGALAALGALAGLTAWTAVSAAWSASPDAALEAAQRDLAYLGLFGLALLGAGSGRHGRLLVWGALAAIVAIGVAGLVNRLYPDLIAGPGSPLGIYRLAYPITYWNGFGALCAMGAVLGIGLGADPRLPAPVRGLTVGASIALAVAMYFSLSRGAWLAGIVALALLVAIAPRRGAVLVSLALVGGAAALAIVRLRHFPALVDDPHLGTGQLRQGHAFARELAGLVAGGVVLGGLAASAGRLGGRRLGDRRPSPRLKRAAAVAGAGLALGAAAVESGRIGDFASRQWRDFSQPAAVAEVGSGRLLDVRGTRSDVYRVALDGFAAAPVIGAGAGSFQSQWYRARRVPQQLVNAHSLELETLDELGLVGGLLLVGLLGSIVVAAVRARSASGALAPPQAAAATAATAVWAVHSAVDWDWQVGAVTGMAIVLAATLFPLGRVRIRAPGQAIVPPES